MTIAQTVQELSPGSIITLVEIDLTSLGDIIYRFHNGTNELNAPVVWQGDTYTQFPIELNGFEITTQGAIPRPTLKLANVSGLIVALLKNFDDIIGAKVTRKRTMVKYLDSINFTGGINPTEDATAYFSDDIYFIDRKVA